MPDTTGQTGQALNVSNLVLNGGAVAILGWLVVSGLPRMADEVKANTAALVELRTAVERLDRWTSHNDPGAARKAKAEVPE